MTNNRNLKRRIRLRASKTGESYSSARSHLVPASRSASEFEQDVPSDYLIRAAHSPAGQAYKSVAVSRLGIQRNSVVLDVGCGTGGDLDLLLGAVGPDGSVIGVDIDSASIEIAAQRCRDDRLRLRKADAHALDMPDASIDRVYVDRTLQHVEAPSTVLDELRRVLHPDGRAAVAEPDWQTLLIDCPEPALSETYRRFVMDRVIRNPRVGSELPRLVQQSGFDLDSVTSATATYTHAVEADGIFGFARVTRRAVAAGYFDRESADRWLGYLGGKHFFASLSIFITSARVSV